MFHKYIFHNYGDKYDIIGKSYIKYNKKIETDTKIIENNHLTILNHIKFPKKQQKKIKNNNALKNYLKKK
jgi:hypothetical protein